MVPVPVTNFDFPSRKIVSGRKRRDLRKFLEEMKKIPFNKRFTVRYRTVRSLFFSTVNTVRYSSSCLEKKLKVSKIFQPLTTKMKSRDWNFREFPFNVVNLNGKLYDVFDDKHIDENWFGIVILVHHFEFSRD